MSRPTKTDPRARLVQRVQELERLEALKQQASDHLKEAFELAESQGFDKATLKVVLKLRKMTPGQRRERRALEAIYMAALGMLEGDALPEEARRRLDEEAQASRPPAERPLPPRSPARDDDQGSPAADAPRPPAQPALELKDPAEAKQEGTAAAAAGKRIYDNPYPAGDPCRAAWDEGWCAKQGSHGMDTPSAYQRRTAATPPKADAADGPRTDLPDEGGA